MKSDIDREDFFAGIALLGILINPQVSPYGTRGLKADTKLAHEYAKHMIATINEDWQKSVTVVQDDEP